MHVRNEEHARGILQKLMTTRSQRIRDGYPYDEVEREFGPRIEQIEKVIQRFEHGEELVGSYRRQKRRHKDW